MGKISVNKSVRPTVGILCLLLFLLTGSVIRGQSFHPDILKVRQIFKQFEYQAVIDSSTRLLHSADSFDTTDVVELYRLLAVSYYSITRMDSALASFIELIRLDPAYQLDKRENSPKIIAFFEEIQRTYPPASFPDNIPTTNSVLDTIWITSPVANRTIACSMLLPGTGHRQIGKQTKGWILSAAAVATLGTAVYFTITTNQLETEYLNALEKADIALKYDDYNRAYRVRNSAWVLFGAVWLYTQIDLLFLSEDIYSEKGISVKLSPFYTTSPGTRMSVLINL